MELEQRGPEDGENLVVVLGWGNQLGHENVEWLLAQFVEEGYRVHAFEIPTVITDFDADWIAPVQRHVEELESFRIVGHSAGGLIAAYIDGAETKTFLSPFWGFPEGQLGVDDALVTASSLLPISKPVLPSGTSSRELIGALATPVELEDGPSRAAPTFIRESRRAHRDLPAITDDAVVFCTLQDQIVSTRAIGEAVPANRIILYDGGHELFASPSREDHLKTLLDAVAHGAGALDG